MALETPTGITIADTTGELEFTIVRTSELAELREKAAQAADQDRLLSARDALRVHAKNLRGQLDAQRQRCRVAEERAEAAELKLSVARQGHEKDRVRISALKAELARKTSALAGMYIEQADHVSSFMQHLASRRRPHKITLDI